MDGQRTDGQQQWGWDTFFIEGDLDCKYFFCFSSHPSLQSKSVSVSGSLSLPLSQLSPPCTILSLLSLSSHWQVSLKWVRARHDGMWSDEGSEKKKMRPALTWLWNTSISVHVRSAPYSTVPGSVRSLPLLSRLNHYNSVVCCRILSRVLFLFLSCRSDCSISADCSYSYFALVSFLLHY